MSNKYSHDAETLKKASTMKSPPKFSIKDEDYTKQIPEIEIDSLQDSLSEDIVSEADIQNHKKEGEYDWYVKHSKERDFRGRENSYITIRDPYKEN